MHKRNKSLHLQLMKSDCSFWNGYYRWECGMTQTNFLQQYSHLPSDRQWDISNISPCDLFNIKCTRWQSIQHTVTDFKACPNVRFYSTQDTSDKNVIVCKKDWHFHTRKRAAFCWREGTLLCIVLVLAMGSAAIIPQKCRGDTQFAVWARIQLPENLEFLFPPMLWEYAWRWQKVPA